MIGKLDPEESVMDSDLIITNRRAKDYYQKHNRKTYKTDRRVELGVL